MSAQRLDLIINDRPSQAPASVSEAAAVVGPLVWLAMVAAIIGTAYVILFM